MMTLTVPAFDGVKQVAKRIITIVEQEWALCAKDGRTSMLFEPWTYEDVPELLFRSNSWEKFRDPAEWLITPEELLIALRAELPDRYVLDLVPYADGAVRHCYRLSYVGKIGGAA
jgi:hypothetical protein